MNVETKWSYRPGQATIQDPTGGRVGAACCSYSIVGLKQSAAVWTVTIEGATGVGRRRRYIYIIMLISIYISSLVH